MSDTVAQYKRRLDQDTFIFLPQALSPKIILAFDLGGTFMNKSLDWNWTLAQETHTALD